MGMALAGPGRQRGREHHGCYGHDLEAGGIKGVIHVGHVSLLTLYPLPSSLNTSIRSTSNTRIERLWVEVGRHFARLWRGLFTRLERDHKLNRKNPEHIWILRFLFMAEIQQDCNEFVKDWNSHPLSGRGCNRSPLVHPGSHPN